MKKLICRVGFVLAVCALVCVLSGQVFAASIVDSGTCGENLTWTLDSNGLLTISGEGDMYAYGYDFDEEVAPWGKEIVEVKITEGVTSIGHEAFQSCNQLTSVTIPKSVVSIGYDAFFLCDNLQGIWVDEENLYYSSDASGILYTKEKTDLLMVPASVTELEIPATVTTICEKAFTNSAATRVVIPGTVTDIEGWAFYGSQVQNVYLMDGITTIKANTFYNCGDYMNIILPASIESVETKAFEDANNRGKIIFLGDAPSMGSIFGYYSSIWPKHNIYYPSGNTTWDSYTSKFLGLAYWHTFNAPSVNSLPEEVTDDYWGGTTVTVTATGSGLTYQWYYKDADMTAFAAVQNGTKSSYYCAIQNLKEGGREVYCVVTDENGIQLKTNTTKIRAELTYIGMTGLSENPNILPGERADVTVRAHGDGLTYKWYFKNKGDTKFYYTSSFEGDTYSIASMDKTRDGRQVYCVVTDKYGDSFQSNTVTIELKEHAKIVTQPKNVNVLEGSTAKVSVKASGDGLLYRWDVLGNSEGLSYGYWTDSNSFSVTMCEKYDGLQVYCEVKDTYGNVVTTQTVTMEMKVPAKILTQPKTTCAKQGATATVTVKAVGDGLKYQWYVKNAGATKWTKSSITTNTYSVKMASSSKDRRVYCVVTDKYGNTVKTNTVYLRMAATVTTQPKTTYTKQGDTAKVTVKASGDGLKYTWYVKNAGSSKWVKSSITTNTYSVKMASSSRDRRVYCVVTDKYGNTVKTNTVYLRMAATVTTQPKTTCTQQGDTAKVTVKAAGDGLKYTWYVKNAGATKWVKSSVTTNTYSVKMASASKDRRVYCVVTDKYGNTVKTNTVYLRMAATITKQPQSIKVKTGSTAAVKVTAKGDGLTYKWYYKNLGDAKFKLTTSFTGNTYSMEMTKARSGRQVYCVITDKYGNSVKTEVVTLKRKLPAITAKFDAMQLQSWQQFGWANEYRFDIESVSGGSGNYTYKIEAYESGYTAPVEVVDYGTQKSMHFYIYGNAGAIHYKVYIKDSEGNMAIYTVSASGNIQTYETK